MRDDPGVLNSPAEYTYSGNGLSRPPRSVIGAGDRQSRLCGHQSRRDLVGPPRAKEPEADSPRSRQGRTRPRFAAARAWRAERTPSGPGGSDRAMKRRAQRAYHGFYDSHRAQCDRPHQDCFLRKFSGTVDTLVHAGLKTSLWRSVAHSLM